MPLIQAMTTPTPTPTPTPTLTAATMPATPAQITAQQHHAKQYAKSMPVTPIQLQSPMEETPSYEIYGHQPSRIFQSDATFHFDDDDDPGRGDDTDDEDDANLEDTSSLAMITPPPPYDTPHLAKAKNSACSTAGNAAASVPPLPPPRKFRFGNREFFSMSPAAATTPTSRYGSAITPTKLSAAAAAMFAAPQMAQLNRKWAHLQRKRRRRNSSSGDSKELDKLVLQSVDWDENEMY